MKSSRDLIKEFYDISGYKDKISYEHFEMVCNSYFEYAFECMSNLDDILLAGFLSLRLQKRKFDLFKDTAEKYLNGELFWGDFKIKKNWNNMVKAEGETLEQKQHNYLMNNMIEFLEKAKGIKFREVCRKKHE